MHPVGIATLSVGLVAVVVLPAAAFSARLRHRLLPPLGIGVAALVAGSFVARGIAEFFIVDFGDPASYQNAWGGPSLAGVLAVHCGPGLAVVVAVVVGFVRRRRRQRPVTEPAGGTLRQVSGTMSG